MTIRLNSKASRHARPADGPRCTVEGPHADRAVESPVTADEESHAARLVCELTDPHFYIADQRLPHAGSISFVVSDASCPREARRMLIEFLRELARIDVRA